MRIDLDARVVASDGEELGTVQRAIVNPSSNAVSELVISTGGIFGHDVLIPADEVARAFRDGNTIRLRMSKDKVKGLPHYVAGDDGAPPAGWLTPAEFGPFATGVGLFLWPAARNGVVPTTEGDIDATDVAGRENPTIAKGALVFDASGEDIRTVSDVLMDEGIGRIRGFVARIGGGMQTLMGGGDKVEIGIDQVEQIAADTVRLRIGAADLHQMVP